MKNLRNIRELNEELRWILWTFAVIWIFGILTSVMGGVIVARLL